MFSTLELSQLSELSLPEQLDRCLSLWTLKEAYIKARGMGFSLPLKKFSFLFGGAEGIRMELDDCLSDSADRWRFCILDHAGHRISVMVPRVESSDPNFEVLEMRPMLSLPARLANIRPGWNPCT
jgi:4'-phosphopantetheinyl transferase